MPKRSDATPRRVVRGEIWIEFDGKLTMTDASADLLEQIIVCGSLSEAARRLQFSYRRAWMLLDKMNRGWPVPLVNTTTGGHRGGGAEVTELGHQVLRSYRAIQLELEHFLGTAGDGFS